MINNDWDEVLSSVWNSPGYKKFMSIIDKKYSETTCFPEYNDIFNALKLTPYSKVKVVILGQDPYHGTGEAHGLSFSVKDDIKKPPSLKNIFKELNEYFYYNYYSLYGIRILFSRILYPSFYFILYDEIISNKKEEKELNKIISRINDYEVYLYNIYLYLRKHYDIPTIEWLKKRGPNPHLQP